jgi:hypothetical protein
MYFTMICTWEPKDEREVRTKMANWEWPKEVQKVLFGFQDLQGRRSIWVIESDEIGLIATRAAWIDLLKFEIFPVYPIGATKALLRK